MLLSHYTPDLIECGCDEAGRGCLAGAVFAAAVILPKDYQNETLNDSKQLSEKQRYLLRDQIEKGEVDTSKHFGICNVSARISSELFGHGTIEINSEEEAGTTVKIEFLQLLP